MDAAAICCLCLLSAERCCLCLPYDLLLSQRLPRPTCRTPQLLLLLLLLPASFILLQ
jgi:hypothetical protein